MDGRVSRSGSLQGSDEFCRKLSESTITGVRNSMAIRAASIATSKHSAGEDAATIGMGDSPWRPNMAGRRSDCSVLVGMPVDGPARITSTMIIGSSVMTARPIVSALRSRPGPAGPGHGEVPGEGRSEGHVGRGDLVFRLHGDGAEVLVLGELMEQV